MDWPLVVVAATVVVGVTLVGAAVRGVLRRRTDGVSNHDLARRLEDRLAETHSTRRTHLERPPTVRTLAAVDRDDDPVYVPVVRVDLGTTDAPGSELVFEFVVSVLEAIHPVLAADDVGVRHYDVEFTFGPDGLLVSGECRRVSIPPELADRLVTDERYRAFDLERDVERGDDGSDEAPVTWGACTSYQ